MLKTLAALSIAVLSVTVAAKSGSLFVSPSVLKKDWRAENPTGVITPLPAATKPLLVDDKTYYPEFVETPAGVGISICWEPVYVKGQPWCKTSGR